MEIYKWKGEWQFLPCQPQQWSTQATLSSCVSRASRTCSACYMRRWHLRIVVREENMLATSEKLIDFYQSLLGPPPRTYNGDQLWSLNIPRTLYLLGLSKHHPVYFCSLSRLPLPPLLLLQIQTNPGRFPESLNSSASRLSRCNFFASLSFWIRFTRSYRLHNVHPCQIMQASSRHVSPPHGLPEILPSLQVPCCGACDYRRRCLYCLPSLLVE